MNGSTLVFHGDRADLEPLFEDWFGAGQLRISEILSGLNSEIRSGCDHGFALSRLAKVGALSNDVMVIGPADRPVTYRKIRMRDGSGEKFSIELTNRFVVGIIFGGQTGATELQPCVLTTSGDDDSASSLFKGLRKSVVQQATKVRECWVLPGAHKKLMEGWRLPGGQFQGPLTDLPTT